MIDFPTINQCILAVAASWCGTTEQTPGLSPQIEYWQRVGGIFSGIDEQDLKWDGLFINAVAHDCLAERPHDGWSGEGVPYATDPRDWLSTQWLPSSEVVGWSLLAPGDVVVWRVGTGTNPGAFRVGVFQSRWGGGALVVSGDIADSVMPAVVSQYQFVGGRRLAFFVGYSD